MSETHASNGLPDACQLPVAWSGLAAWRVLEVCGADASNFLGTWSAWRADPDRCRMLHYVVIVPDHLAFSRPALAPGHPHSALATELAHQAWGLLPGVHRLAFDSGQVLLTACIGNAESFLRQQAWTFDLIFWHTAQGHGSEQPLLALKSFARCSALNALLVGSGAAAPAAKLLTECGFTAAEPVALGGNQEKVWRCRYSPAWSVRPPRSMRHQEARRPARCIVIGAGLSGAAVAASLARRGWQVTVLDAAGTPAAGASGLPVGLFVPNLSADDNPIARISRAGVRATVEACTRLLEPGVDWLASGVLERRLPGKLGLSHSGDGPNGSSNGPAADWACAESAERAQAVGLPAGSLAVQHKCAGWVKPAQLVAALLAQPGVQFQAHGTVQQLQRQAANERQASADTLWHVLGVDGALLGEAELVVVACGPASGTLLQTAGLDPLPLNSIRGQLSWGLQSDAMALPMQPVNGHGALIAQVPVGGGLAWHAGSTFERECTQLPVKASDQSEGHATNLDNLRALLPDAAQGLALTFSQGAPALEHWAGVRCTVPDRLPLVGPVAPDVHPGLWLCTGMGARGLSRAVLCGELLAAQLHAEPLPLEARLAAAMAADRFQINSR